MPKPNEVCICRRKDSPTERGCSVNSLISWDDLSGIPKRIEQSQKTVNTVVQFVKNRQNDEIEKQIHCVWLCTNSQGERWQDVHKSILKVVNDLSIPCIVIITQCYGDHEKYVEYVEHNVPAGVSVIPVLAKALELPGTKVEAWGIDDLTSTTERVGLKYISQVKKSKVLAKSASIAKKTIGDRRERKKY